MLSDLSCTTMMAPSSNLSSLSQSKVRVEGLETLDYLDNLQNKDQFTEQAWTKYTSARIQKLRMRKCILFPSLTCKIGNHPNIYVLDTPGVLPPMIPDAEVCSKLALTGAINDCLIGESELAQYFLAIHNLSDEYKKWTKLSMHHIEKITVDGMETSNDSAMDKRRKQA